MSTRSSLYVVVREDNAQYLEGGEGDDWTREPGAAERFLKDEAFKRAFELDRTIPGQTTVIPESKITT